MENMDNARFIELAKAFLKYSFDDINFQYRYLSGEEKLLITEEEFEIFIQKISE